MKLLAFMLRDIRVALSYRLQLVLGLLRGAVLILMFFFLGQTFGGAISPHLAAYGGDYFPYALVGLAVSSFVAVGLRTLSDEIRNAQVQGTLEALLATPSSVYTILLGNSFWKFVMALLGAVAMLGAGVLFVGLQVTLASASLALLVLAMTFVAFVEVGALSASFVMIFKQGNPINFVFGTSSYFLGGVLFPVEVLPQSFQVAANALPITHATRALRDLLLARMELADVLPVLSNLLVFIVILAPLSVLLFRYAVRRAKVAGSLVQF